MKSNQNKNALLILILGALTALSPFSIDMYLPAFQKMATAFGTGVSEVSLSLSSYFVGLAVGQLFYGPLLDRFGRKKPLYVGLVLYILATIGCLMSTSIEGLIAFRFLQAIGGCAANVASVAMVRDLFTAKESAKVFSLLMLILGVSPLVAPTAGGYLASVFGWQAVFISLGIIGALMLVVSFTYLPESHKPDASQSLRPGPIIKDYLEILKNPQFYTYTFAGALAFSGLFVYVAGSPIIFMEIFQVSERTYGWIFAGLAVGFVGASQLNLVLLKKFSNEQILLGSLMILVITGLSFFIGAFNNWYGIGGTIGTLFLFLSCVGLANPNGAALALAPFAKDAGKASALMGSLQMGTGALASVAVGVLKAQQIFPIAAVFASSALLALGILIFGNRRMTEKVEVSSDETSAAIAH
ncbi:multidrug effflux MFS transporter [Bdellovibrio sp. HCB2-146]|uniref:multidrug effflux MFS transporter n=1 Tax=Bdellovibrio sp. HCB2-146 TaxID=3394362 RepID=UPI0039BD60BB